MVARLRTLFASPWGPYTPEPSGRDLRIDLLRGFCVVAMIVDHIGGPSPLYAFTGGNHFFTSSAGAFIFISGLVMGMIYHVQIARDGLGALVRVMRRALTLYLLTVTLTLILIPVSETLSLPWSQGLDLTDPISLVISVLTLHRTYYLVDIPLLYTLVIMLAPLALILLARGLTLVLISGSVLLWGLYQVFPAYADLPWDIEGNALFHFSPWQIFFVVGLALGWHGKDLAPRITDSARRRGLAIATMGFGALVVFYNVMGGLTLEGSAPGPSQDLKLFLLQDVFSKADVRPGRLVAAVFVFAFFYLLTTGAWRPIRGIFGRLLLPLGQNALYAYSAHVLLAVPVALLVEARPAPLLDASILNLVAQIVVVCLIRALISCRFAFVDDRRGWARYTYPAAATFACLLVLPFVPSAHTHPVAAANVEADPYATAVARAFGTPVPATGLRAQVAPLVPAKPAAPPPALADQVRTYASSVKGTLLAAHFYSSTLGAEMPYVIYLPPRYPQTNQVYPTLYMLHGWAGTAEEWLGWGLVTQADRMIVSGELQPLVIVLPQGDQGFWINRLDGGPQWADYLAGGLVRHIEATYPVIPDADHRAIGGLSTGGAGALTLGFTRPDLFHVIGAHSPALPEEGERDTLGTGADFVARDPISLAEAVGPSDQLSLWIDVGSWDDWRPRAKQLHEILSEHDIAHQWHVHGGGHGGEYWTGHVVDYLRFYGQALHTS